MSQPRSTWSALPSYARVGIAAFVSFVAAIVIFGTEIGTYLWAAGLCTWFIIAVARIAWRERRTSDLERDVAQLVEDEHRFTEIVSNWDE